MSLSFGENIDNRLPPQREHREHIDYEEQRASAIKNLEAIVRGLEIAMDKKGEKKPDLTAVDNNELRMYIDQFDRIIEGARGVKNFSGKEYDAAVGEIETAKLFLTKYLSEKQFIALFGTDNLA